MLGDLPYQVQPLPGSYQASRSAASSWQTPSSDARGGRTLDSSSKSNGSFIKNFTPYQVPYTSLTNRKAARYAKGVAQKAESIRPLTVSYRTNTDFGRSRSIVKPRPASSLSPSRSQPQTWNKYHQDIQRNAQNWYERTDRYTAQAYGGVDFLRTKEAAEPAFVKDNGPTYEPMSDTLERHFRHVGNTRSNAPLPKKEIALPPPGWTKDMTTLDRSLTVIPKLQVPARFKSTDVMDTGRKTQHPLYTTFAAQHGVRPLHSIELPDKYFGLSTKFTGGFSHKFRRHGLNSHVGYSRADRAMNVM